jgi:protein arginine N-methyltransferase 1
LAPLIRPVSVDYADVTSPNLDSSVRWTVERSGTAHGFGAGIDRLLVDGVGFSNAPDCANQLPPDSIFRTAFFPWSSPVSLAIGDVVLVELRAALVGDDYVWSWKATVWDQGCTDRVKARFDQSTLYGVPLSIAQLHKRSASHLPKLNEEGDIISVTLDLMRLAMPLSEIAGRLREQFPSRFPDCQRALAYVSDLSHQYSQ